MQSVLLIMPVLLPILAGALIPAFHFREAGRRQLYVAGSVILTSVLIFALILRGSSQTVTLLRLTPGISISFRIDGLSRVFAGLLALLWPLAVFYAFSYMRREGKENAFFTWYTITYGVAVGVAFSANLITLYLCYELLTLVTLPMIMHEMDVRAIHAGRRYLLYSMAGASFAFMGMILLYNVTGSLDFVYGGLLPLMNRDLTGQQGRILFAYLLTFFGFGVKAAVWPLHGWLPAAGVAPTPVTALLHAVAVVKAGVFAIMRVTYFSFGTEALKGTWVQYTVMGFACFTILFGSCCAIKEQHLKHRLAYSTISNLSYILFGVTLMTPEGLGAGLSHMVFHGIMKICLFFGAGAVITCTGKEYIYQMKGFGKKMPVTFGCFTVGSLAVIGLPGLCGFISKWYLCEAAIVSDESMAMVGVAALIASAALTSVYLFTVIVPVFFPEKDFDEGKLEAVHDPGLWMKVPMLLLCLAMLGLGLFSGPLIRFFMNVGAGLA